MFKKDLAEYSLFKERFNKFILDEQWRYSLMFDCILIDAVKEQVDQMIDFFETAPNVDAVEKFLLELRTKSLKCLEESQIQLTTESSWLKAREAYAYYGLGEVITEGSVYSENLANELKEKFGDNYLNILENIDKISPSILTNFNHTQLNLEVANDEVVKKYLLLKKWQDNQNIYHNGTLYPVFSKYRDEYKNYYLDNYGEIDCGAREMLILSTLRQSPILPIDTFSIWIDVGLSQPLTSVIGGKNYGLAVLKNKGMNIPNTWVLTLNSDISHSFLANLPKDKYAIRSSASGEDGQKNSFAGMFDSVLDVDKDNILDAIQQVKSSCLNPRVQSYVKKFNLKQPQMSVVIQKFIAADISGVWLGREENAGVIEWVSGSGDQLVSGKVTPQTEFIDADNVSNSKLTINGKPIASILLEYQKTLKNICDFEFCIKNNELFMLQYRPVTEIISKVKQDRDSTIKGTPASKGVAEGEVCFLDDVDEIANFKPNSILLTYYTDPDWVEAMVKAKAIVTAEGGFLCHTAIIARELGIPCITGIGGANLRKLSKFHKIIVNGNTGGIKPVLVSKKNENLVSNNKNDKFEF